MRGLVTRTRRRRRRLTSGVAPARPGPPDQHVAQLAGVPAADGQLRRRRPATRAPAGVDAHLVDVRQRDQQRAVDAHEAGVAPVLLEGGQRGADQVAAVGGVQPRVVALRLGVEHLAARDEPGHAAELDRDGVLVAAAPGAADRLDDPADRLGQPVVAHRLEHVVDGVELEGVDGVLVVRGDEHDRRRWCGSATAPGPGRARSGRASGCR